MKELAAYLLLAMAGKTPSAADVGAVISAAGGEADEEKLNLLISDLEGKDIDAVIAENKEKLKNVSFGGGGGGGGGGVAAATDAAPAAAAKPKEEEVDALDGGMGKYRELFLHNKQFYSPLPSPSIPIFCI